MPSAVLQSWHPPRSAVPLTVIQLWFLATASKLRSPVEGLVRLHEVGSAPPLQRLRLRLCRRLRKHEHVRLQEVFWARNTARDAAMLPGLLHSPPGHTLSVAAGEPVWEHAVGRQGSLAETGAGA